MLRGEGGFAEVIVPSRLKEPLTYEVPPDLRDRLKVRTMRVIGDPNRIRILDQLREGETALATAGDAPLRFVKVAVGGDHAGFAMKTEIASLLIYLRGRTGKRPHACFIWSEGNPVLYKALIAALKEATDIVDKDRAKAAAARRPGPRRARRPHGFAKRARERRSR